jgi:hypothetical protein
VFTPGPQEGQLVVLVSFGQHIDPHSDHCVAAGGAGPGVAPAAVVRVLFNGYHLRTIPGRPREAGRRPQTTNKNELGLSTAGLRWKPGRRSHACGTLCLECCSTDARAITLTDMQRQLSRFDMSRRTRARISKIGAPPLLPPVLYE